MASHGRKYREAAKLINPAENYAPVEAISLVKKTAYTKFDATVEVHLRMGVDPRQADQQVRGVVLLPHGTGKKVRILVFAEGDAARAAEEAGADFVGSDDIVKKIQEQDWLDFDVAIATPQLMGKVGRMGKILGPRGLMPNPKAGTVVSAEDLPRTITELRMGRVEFRLDKTGNMHVPIGKVSFSDQSLIENFGALVDAIQRAKPSGAKGNYIRRLYLAPTMGPGVKVDILQAVSLKVA